MHSILPDYYFSLLEVFVILLLIGTAGIAICWEMRRRWQNSLWTLKRKHVDDLKKHDSELLQKLHNDLQNAVAHEFGRGLDNILEWSAKTLEQLGDEQLTLRQKQKKIIVKVFELDQHAANIQTLFAPERDESEKELLNMRRFVEGVLSELNPFAESKGVTLMMNLSDVEPTVLNRDLTLLVSRNVIHNAIRYSLPGGVVKTILYLKKDVLEGAAQAICVDVEDTGKGVREEDQGRIFELSLRGDGLIEPGSGLGLYLARKAARRQGGDVILVNSSLNQGSVFRILFPHSDNHFDL